VLYRILRAMKLTLEKIITTIIARFDYNKNTWFSYYHSGFFVADKVQLTWTKHSTFLTSLLRPEKFPISCYRFNVSLLRFSITCGLQNSKLNRQMRFSLPSIKCSAAPPSLRLCYLNCAQRFDLITARLVVVGSKEEPPNMWLTAAKSAFVGWALNFGVRMLLKSAVTWCE